jgi:uncharacterized protein YkwD
MNKKVFQFFIVTLAIVTTSTPWGVYAYTARSAIHADSVLAYTNAERYKRDIPFLSTNDALSQVARQKMLDLFARQYFAHESPTGESVSDLAKEVGYKYIVVGENLALGDFGTSKAVVDAWMNSLGHKKNILSESYSEIGIAAGRGMYEGRNTWIIVQSFGYPSASCPAVDKTLEEKLAKFDSLLAIYGVIAEKREKIVLEEKGTLEERKAQVESYNVAARLYNETVDKYKDVVKEYNSEIGEFNSCVKKVTAKMEH